MPLLGLAKNTHLDQFSLGARLSEQQTFVQTTKPGRASAESAYRTLNGRSQARRVVVKTGDRPPVNQSTLFGHPLSTAQADPRTLQEDLCSGSFRA